MLSVSSYSVLVMDGNYDIIDCVSLGEANECKVYAVAPSGESLCQCNFRITSAEDGISANDILGPIDGDGDDEPNSDVARDGICGCRRILVTYGLQETSIMLDGVTDLKIAFREKRLGELLLHGVLGYKFGSDLSFVEDKNFPGLPGHRLLRPTYRDFLFEMLEYAVGRAGDNNYYMQDGVDRTGAEAMRALHQAGMLDLFLENVSRED